MPAFRAAASNSAAAVTSIPCNLPAGTQDGDALLAVVLVSGTNHTASAPGWAQDQAQVAQGPSLTVLKKIAAGEGASTTFSWSGSGNAVVMVIAFSAGNVAAIVNSSSAPHRTATTTVVTADATTTTIAGCLVVAIGTVNIASAFTTAAGFTARAALNDANGSIAVQDQVQAAAGAIGPSTMAATSGTTQGLLVALAPAPAASTGSGARLLTGVGV